MTMLKSALAAAVIAAAVAGPAHAKMVCTPNPLAPSVGQSCVDKDVERATWVKLYCSYHPGDLNCAALGYRAAASDPIDQAVDRRLVDHFCAANPTLERCISPFPHAVAPAREECAGGNITANCVILPKPGTHKCPAGYSWDESMKACNDD
jgi:hypothetical protein